jgi:LysR family transcriptional regulator, hydrogen peroxide-inducible genes activator
MVPLPSPQQLRYLIALAETRHFGRAALACSVTQSTLSAGLLTLERQLDAPILDRSTGKHVIFTPLGQELVAHARNALTALAAVTEAADAARTPMSAPLRIGVIPTIGPFLLPRLMPALREAFPLLKPWLREDTTANLVVRLEAARLDVAILALPCDCADADHVILARDEFVVALPPNHPLTGMDVIPTAALAPERLLLLEEGHCLREQALAVCGLMAGDRGESMDGFAATSLHTLVQMVASGLGVTLLPRIAVCAGVLTGTDVVLRPLSGAGAWRSLGLAWRRNAPQYRALGAKLGQVCAALLGEA